MQLASAQSKPAASHEGDEDARTNSPSFCRRKRHYAWHHTHAWIVLVHAHMDVNNLCSLVHSYLTHAPAASHARIFLSTQSTCGTVVIHILIHIRSTGSSLESLVQYTSSVSSSCRHRRDSCFLDTAMYEFGLLYLRVRSLRVMMS